MGKVNKRKNHYGNGGAHMQHPIQHPIQAPLQDQAKIKKELELETGIFEMFGKMVDLVQHQGTSIDNLKSVLHQPIDNQKGGMTYQQYYLEKIAELKVLLPGQPLKIPIQLHHILQAEIYQKKPQPQQVSAQQPQQQQQQLQQPQASLSAAPQQQENMQVDTTNQAKQQQQMMQQQQQMAAIQGAQQKAQKFQPQFDPSQYQSFNQVGKNIQDLQEQFAKQNLPQKMVPHPPQKHQVPKSPQKQQIEQMQMIKKQIMKESGHSLTEQQMEQLIMQIIKNGGPHFDKQKKTISVNIDGQIIEAPNDGSYQYQQQFALTEGNVNFHHSSNDIEDMSSNEQYEQQMTSCPRNNLGGQQCMGENCSCAMQNEGDEECGDDGEDDQEEDDEEFEDEEDEYYPESMQYEAANQQQQNQQQQQYHQNNGAQQMQQQNNQMVEDEDDEEEYENDEYAEDEEEEEEEELEDENEDMETMENSNGSLSFTNSNTIHQQQQNNSSRYDYATDNEGEDDDQNLMDDPNTSTLADISQDSVTMRILQTEISQEDFNNFQHKCTLNLPSQLSQKFVRLSKEFNNNIDYIMSYVYKLVGQQQLNQTISQCASQPSLQQPEQFQNSQAQPGAINPDGTPSLVPEKNRFATKYENLIKQSTELCRKYTGPHSVLQIFLEKIIHCIGKISLHIKIMAKNELMLWKEYKTVVRKTSALQRSSSADSSLLITTTSNNQDKNSNGAQAPRLIRPHQMEESYNISVRFKPLIANIEAYTRFLQEVQQKYLFIMKSCATSVSRHFTTMTAVIIEGNSYEFPSVDLHKAIINKLIMNDSHHFKQFFVHIKRQYKKDEAFIKENFPEFTKIVESFLQQLEQDSQKSINIDQYMRDLKRHAYAEYKTLYEREQNTNCNSDSKSRRKKKKDKLKKAAAIAASNQTQPQPSGQQQQQQQIQGYNQQVQQPIPPQSRQNQQQNSGSQQQHYQQQQPVPPQNHQQQRRINNQQSQGQNVQAPQYNNWIDPQPGMQQNESNQENQQQQYAVTGKKKRNRKRKKQDGKLTAEEIHNMPTEDLCNYIENKANQNLDANGMPIVGGPVSGVQNQRAASKIKKKITQNMNGSTMSIEDQESKRLEMHILEDINKLQNFTQNEYKNMNIKDIQSNFQNVKDQQRNSKQPKMNYQVPQNPRRSGFEVNNIPCPQQFENPRSDFNLEDSQIQFINQNNGMINDQQCNYCNGSIHTSAQGQIFFCHDEKCMFFKRDYGSENDEDSESEGIQLSNNGNNISSGKAPSASEDVEADREVEILRKRLERFEMFSLKKKMKPNINKDWITKLKEKIRILNYHSNGSPAAPALSAERGPSTSQKANTSSQSTANNGGGRISQSQRLGGK